MIVTFGKCCLKETFCFVYAFSKYKLINGKARA